LSEQKTIFLLTVVKTEYIQIRSSYRSRKRTPVVTV